ncbi:MAG TPA: glycoside hydrolase family 97 protein [Balneolales bacterium]|nr:glycoside hydrolase family 97 protein [Balneolales bacterium]
MKYLWIIVLGLCGLFSNANAARRNRDVTVYSPNKQVKVTVTVGTNISYAVTMNGKSIIQNSPIAMTLENGDVLGSKPRLRHIYRHSENKTVTPLYGANDHIQDHYNQIRLRFRKHFSLIFRVFNNGVAYRFMTNLKGQIEVKNEEVEYHFPTNEKAWYLNPGSTRWHGYESNYSYGPISNIDSVKVALPMVIDHNSGIKVAITEASLLDYPGEYLVPDPQQENTLKAIMPAYPTKTEHAGHNNYDQTVTQRADYIAKTQGTRSFPWRLMVLAKQDKDLLNTQLVYLLAPHNKLEDTSWIKPGLVSWDWWNALNLKGVNFTTGINMNTYKYFIDFASENGIPYVNLDEGWSDQFNLLKVNPKLNIKELAAYAHKKHVGLILWCIARVLNSQMQQAMDQFEKWGIAGVKVDFMDRDDQIEVNFYRRTAEMAAKHHLMVDFHGAFKPTGLSRMYPNVINREAVLGLEYNKWSKKDTPRHNVMLPFTRLVAGSMDFTPGSMHNYNKQDFRPIMNRPMTMGTRCQQLAMYVAYYAPLQMLADAPTTYQADPNVLTYLKKVPTTWDQTVPIAGKIGKYLLTARRKGNTWYVGGMTNWTPRNVNLFLSFLGKGEYTAKVFSDGVNADRIGSDYKLDTLKVNQKTNLLIHMAPGGGWVAVIKPVNSNQ